MCNELAIQSEPIDEAIGHSKPKPRTTSQQAKQLSRFTVFASCWMELRGPGCSASQPTAVAALLFVSLH
eukprot:7034703-Pyramimonas_sp.AAC.1